MNVTPRSIKIIHITATVMLTIIVSMYVANSIFNYEIFSSRFASLGYPVYLIYPLTVANILGIMAIWYRRINLARDTAYAGFMFNFIFAFAAELTAIDKDLVSPIIAMIALLISFATEREWTRTAPS